MTSAAAGETVQMSILSIDATAAAVKLPRGGSRKGGLLFYPADYSTTQRCSAHQHPPDGTYEQSRLQQWTQQSTVKAEPCISAPRTVAKVTSAWSGKK